MGLRAAAQYKTLEQSPVPPPTQLVAELPEQQREPISLFVQHLINVRTPQYSGHGRGQTLQVMKT